MMTGWKTWVAAIALAALGVIDIVNGDADQGMTKLISALGIVGIGHKIEKGGK